MCSAFWMDQLDVCVHYIKATMNETPFKPTFKRKVVTSVLEYNFFFNYFNYYLLKESVDMYARMVHRIIFRCVGVIFMLCMFIAELNYFTCFQFNTITWNENIPLLKNMGDRSLVSQSSLIFFLKITFYLLNNILLYSLDEPNLIDWFFKSQW